MPRQPKTDGTGVQGVVAPAVGKLYAGLEAEGANHRSDVTNLRKKLV